MPDGFAAKIAALNNFEPATAGFSPFIIAGEPLGWLGSETADLLQALAAGTDPKELLRTYGGSLGGTVVVSWEIERESICPLIES